MKTLHLLFIQDGIQFLISEGKKILHGHSYFKDENSEGNLVSEKLNSILEKETYDKISVVSAINHFTLMPENFDQHELGYDLIEYNSDADRNNEELMLSINKKMAVQFYYTFPKEFYQRIKEKNLPTTFNFSGEKFLNSVNSRGGKEIHINLYHHQCEFFALDEKKLVLYNNLDVSSEVDFLYFVMFTLNKIGFILDETQFYVYGETVENDTFISELQKFVKDLRIVFDNTSKKNFILN